MPLAGGARLGVYEIVGPIGAGGMGEVYRAHDSRLGRDVAIKVLPESLKNDPAALARFDREARAIGALSHPNIIGIFDVGSDAGVAYVVMELLDGETLRARLAAALPTHKALEIGAQIAQGLAAAHSKAIIHRDLKPENIFLTSDGRVKILDFGLARQDRSADAKPQAVDVEPTALSPIGTEPGFIVGTVGYMAPEQVRAQAVDHRADIFSFGAVLFEMITGRRAFVGDSAVETMNAILTTDPFDRSVGTGLSSLPPMVERLIRHCLEKRPDERFQSARDLAFQIQSIQGAPASGASGRLPALADAMPPRARPRIGWLWAGVAAIAASVATAAIVWQLRAPTAAPVRRFTVPTPNGAAPLQAAIAPNGTMVAFIAGERVWLQRLDAFSPVEVPASGGAHALFWSPDSTQFGFQARGQLWRASVSGGAPTAIGRVPQEFTSSGGATWLEDSRILFTTGGTGLLEIPAGGGESKPFFEIDRAQEADLHQVTSLPGGKAVIFVPHSLKRQMKIDLLEVDSRERVTIFEGGTAPILHPTYSTSGHILFEQGAGIWALPFSLSTLRATGEAFLVAADSRQPTVSADGTLVTLPGAGFASDLRLTWIDRDGKETRTFPQQNASTFLPRLSPDGRFVAATVGSPAESDIWIFDVGRGTNWRLTFEPGPDTDASWSPDGQVVVYMSGNVVCARRADGSGSRVELLKDTPAAWLSPDGKMLVFVRSEGGVPDIWIVEVGASGLTAPITAKPKPFITAPREQRQVDISPDSRYAAYISAEGGTFTAFITQFPSGSGKWELPLGFAARPRWGSKGDRLYIVDELNRIVEFEVDTKSTFTIGPPRVRTPTRSPISGVGFERSLDGKEFIVPLSPGGTGPQDRLLVVQNWSAQPRK